VRRLPKTASALVLAFFLLPGPLDAVRDAGTTQIVFPNGEIRYRQWMLPLNVQAQAVVKNFGDSAASFPVWFRMDTTLVGMTQVANLPPQETALVQFPVTLPESGMHSIACSTALVGDDQPANDRIAAWFETWESHLDVGLFPSCTLRIGDTLVPLASARNRAEAEGAMFLLTISRLADSTVVYSSAESVYLLPQQSALVTFDAWTPDSAGVYKCLLRIGRLTPQLPDTLSCFVTVLGAGVEERETPGAGRMTPVPTIVRGVLFLGPSAVGCEPSAVLLDISGRCVAALHPGANDVSRLGAGVYFVWSEPSAVSREPSAVHRVVIAR